VAADLPDIPDEALHAAVETAAVVRKVVALTGEEYPGDLEAVAISAALIAAWPHLYAAALRNDARRG
jgi:hypothetical protein